MEVKITRINHPADKPHMVYLDSSVVDSSELPQGAISLAELAEAEQNRAAQARRFQDGSLIGALLGRESERQADTSLAGLTRNLPSGAVVFEEISQEA